MHRLTAILLGMTLLFCPLALAAPEGLPDKQPDAPKASDALIITFADAGKTVKLPVGRAIEVRLEGELPGTGWESSPVTGKAVEREGARPGEVNATSTSRFIPGKDATDKSIGTYIYRYQTVEEGKAILRFVYVMPGGPFPIRRSATKLVREMTVTLEVGKEAAAKGEK